MTINQSILYRLQEARLEGECFDYDLFDMICGRIHKSGAAKSYITQKTYYHGVETYGYCDSFETTIILRWCLYLLLFTKWTLDHVVDGVLTNKPVNDRAAFKWKLRCHWLKVCGTVISFMLQSSLAWKFRKSGSTKQWRLAGPLGHARQYITDNQYGHAH